jgi:2-hydroxychromene-2-carboxylate isomerase
LAARAKAHLVWSPVLLGAIYKETKAPQGAAGSASDVFNAAKKDVSSKAFERTLKRYKIPLNFPSKHPQKTTSALRLIYWVRNEERAILTKALFKAYWVDNRDISDRSVLLDVARKSGTGSAWRLSEAVFSYQDLHDALRTSTSATIERGAPGVPAFYIPGEKWVRDGRETQGRLYWGQDRMHFVEAVLIALDRGIEYGQVPALGGLQPRCLRVPPVPKQRRQTLVEFWYDFSSPWAFLGWTQLERLKREAGTGLKIVMKPILLGGLFRE